MNPFVLFVALLIAATPHSRALAEGDVASLRVTVENLKNRKGQVVVAVFASKADYLKRPVEEAMLEIREDLTAETTFGDLPAGTYAIAVYHDKNGNGDLDTFLAIPREDYGFSNDARSLVGPPSFKSAAVELEAAQDAHITIRSK